MPKPIVVPILIDSNQSLKKLAYLSFKADSSVYLYFPRKEGYFVSREAEHKLRTGTQKITLSRVSGIQAAPYISYHPGKGVIHLNLQPEGRYKNDTASLNYSEIPGTVCFPLCQIINFDFSYLDEAKISKYDHPLIIKDNKRSSKSLMIEVWLHTKGTYVEPSDLPNMKEKLKTQEMIGFLKLQDPRLDNMTASLLITAGEYEKQDKTDARHVVVVWRKGSPLFFEMSPK